MTINLLCSKFVEGVSGKITSVRHRRTIIGKYNYAAVICTLVTDNLSLWFE